MLCKLTWSRLQSHTYFFFLSQNYIWGTDINVRLGTISAKHLINYIKSELFLIIFVNAVGSSGNK